MTRLIPYLPYPVISWLLARATRRLARLEAEVKALTELLAAIEEREYTSGHRKHLAREIEYLNGERFRVTRKVQALNQALLS